VTLAERLHAARAVILAPLPMQPTAFGPEVVVEMLVFEPDARVSFHRRAPLRARTRQRAFT
jgi:hypothetical protein